MKAVLRIALGYFSVVPLQRWLNMSGFGLMIIAALLALPGVSVGAREMVPVPLVLGVTLILLGVSVGGIAMRYASTRAVLHQRPRGRLKMWLGASLTLALISLLATLVLVIIRPSASQHVHDEFWRNSLFDLFAFSCSIAILFWIAVFIFSGGQFRLLLTFIAIVSLDKLGKYLPHIAPPHVASSGAYQFGMPIRLAFSVAAWLVFGCWYMTTRTVRRPAWFAFPNAREASGYTFPDRLMARRLESGSSAASPLHAARQFIGDPPLRRLAVTGILGVLAFTMLGIIWRKVFAQAPAVPPFSLLILVLTCAGAGMAGVRIARRLWLPAGLDRAALFAMLEKHGLRASMTIFAAAAGTYLIISIVSRPDYALFFCLFALSQLAFGVCLFYGGLSFTRGWAMQEAMTGLGLLFVIQVIATIPAMEAYPPRHVANTVAFVALLAFVLLIPLLRRHARRRWRTLDWRVVRPIAMNPRAP